MTLIERYRPACTEVPDYDRPFVGAENLSEYIAVDKTRGPPLRLGDIRLERMRNDRRMKPPPSSLRILPGYLTVRKLGTPSEYETWIPDHTFEEIYRRRSRSGSTENSHHLTRTSPPSIRHQSGTSALFSSLVAIALQRRLARCRYLLPATRIQSQQDAETFCDGPGEVVTARSFCAAPRPR